MMPDWFEPMAATLTTEMAAQKFQTVRNSKLRCYGFYDGTSKPREA